MMKILKLIWRIITLFSWIYIGYQVYQYRHQFNIEIIWLGAFCIFTSYGLYYNALDRIKKLEDEKFQIEMDYIALEARVETDIDVLRSRLNRI